MSDRRCNATTKTGSQCKCFALSDSNLCSIHTTLGDCSICMDSINGRGSRRLKCGHIFHTTCLEQWKSQGKNTCPTCRQYFDCSAFQVTLSIFNTSAQSTSTLNLPPDVVNQLITGMGDDAYIDFDSTQTEITFDIETVSALTSLLDDLGTSLSNVHPSTLDTV